MKTKLSKTANPLEIALSVTEIWVFQFRTLRNILNNETEEKQLNFK